MSEHMLATVAGAVQDFRKARRRAAMRQVLARLQGRPTDLLSYEHVVQQIKTGEKVERGLQDVPLDAIVGSVGRYSDFTRDFLPKLDSDEERWTRVREMMMTGRPMEPIELYKIGEAYFVLDGNHRVSVSREMGFGEIQARVTEIKASIPLSLEDDPDAIICKVRRSDFFERTGLLARRPAAKTIDLTACGHYRALEDQIELQRFLLFQEKGKAVTLPEAAVYWYDHVYVPVCRTIRAQGLLRDFPGRTEADLFVFLSNHRQELVDEIGFEVDTATLASDVAEKLSPRPQRVIARVGERLKQAVFPDRLEAGPGAGQWRRERLAGRRQDRLFMEVLLVLSDIDQNDEALDNALLVAERESARLHCHYSVDRALDESRDKVAAVQETFTERCAASGIRGAFMAAPKMTAREIARHARWVDLVVTEITHPPGPEPMAKLASRVHNFLQRCPRPILAVPAKTTATRLSRALLAYDGSPKADEALYTAAYLAKAWSLPLFVLTVTDLSPEESPSSSRARQYLAQRDVIAQFITRDGEVAPTILNAVAEFDCDLIIMGGFGFRPVLEVVMGSAVEQVLRQSDQPILVCR